MSLVEALDRRMARAACLLLLAFLCPGAALAQDSGVDLVLRGTEDADAGPAPPAPRPIGAERELGPPLAGPDGTAAIGPDLLGPTASQPQPQTTAEPPPRDDDADPFAAAGIRLGSFVLRPAIDIGIEASDNIHLSQPQQRAVGWLVAPDIELRSDWDRHEVAFELRGTATYYDDDSLNEVEGRAALAGRYDISQDTSLDAAVATFRGTESFTDPDLPAGAAERPAFRELEAELGAAHDFGRFGVGVRGRVERTEYDDVALVSGGTAGLDDRDNTETELRMRGSYRASPAFEPFVEVAAGRVRYDRARDSAGFARSSAWRELVGGIVVDLGPKLAGEVAVGHRSETFDDPRLEDLDGVLASARLLWSPRRLTQVRLELATNASGSTLAGVAGSLTHSALVAVERRMRHDLTLEAGLSFARETFVGLDRTDDTFGGYAELAYDLNRNLALVGRYEYEQLISDDLCDCATENVVSVRVRLKR
jgi:hypothetical protein